MSEDKINKEQRAATQTVAKALDDAIGDDDPVEHGTALPSEIKMEGIGKRPLTPTSSRTGKHATKRDLVPSYVNSYWTPERKREAAGDEDPTREHVNARKRGNRRSTRRQALKRRESTTQRLNKVFVMVLRRQRPQRLKSKSMAARAQTTRNHVKMMMQSIRSSTPRVKTPTSKTRVRWTIVPTTLS